MRLPAGVRRMLRWLTGLAALVCPAAAVAGPPYGTDDPVPTDRGAWEIYAFADGTIGGGYDGTAGLDLNYGAATDIQLTATLPVDARIGSAGRVRFGDVELGVKWRFADDPRHGAALAVFPRAILPTAAGNHGGIAVLLPVWGQVDRGKWSVFGGGGLLVAPGAGRHNAWQGGIAVTRQVSPRLVMGLEATAEGATEPDAAGVWALSIGSSWKLGGPFSLLMRAGPQFAFGTGHASASIYAALAANF